MFGMNGGQDEPVSGDLAHYLQKQSDMHSSWLKRIALSALCWASIGSAASAQALPGTSIPITDSGGREDKARVVDVAGDIVTISPSDGIRRFRTADVLRVSVRQSDSVINGALIGAGIGVGSGLAFCMLMEPWEVCNNPRPLLTFGAIGAGIGIGVDALIRGHKTIYDANQGSPRLNLVPIVARREGGLQISFAF